MGINVLDILHHVTEREVGGKTCHQPEVIELVFEQIIVREGFEFGLGALKRFALGKG